MKRPWEKVITLASGNLGLKIFSLVFALGLWLFVNAGQKATERSIVVPLEFRNMSSDLMVASSGPGQIEVWVMGAPALLSTLDPDTLRVALDLEGARSGTSTFRLSPDSFNPPRGVRITRISPSVINVKLDSVAERSLPVIVRFAGKLPFGYKVARIEVNPATVKARGAANELVHMTSVDTLPFELDGRQSVTREMRLSSPGKSLSFSPERVTVSVALEDERIVREFRRVEVKAKDFHGRYRVSPQRVYLRLSGPMRILDKFQLGDEQVYLELKGLSPGIHAVPLSLKLPPEINVEEKKPDHFKVRILNPEP